MNELLQTIEDLESVSNLLLDRQCILARRKLDDLLGILRAEAAKIDAQTTREEMSNVRL